MNRRKRREDVSYRNVASFDTEILQAVTGAGKTTAIKIGEAAGAKIKIGRRTLWNAARVYAYLDSIAE